MKKSLLFLLTLLLTCSMSMWGRNYQSYTYEHTFSWNNDLYVAGIAVTGDGFNMVRIQCLNNLRNTGTAGYPAFNIDMVTTTTENQVNGYKKYTLTSFASGQGQWEIPYIGSYSSTTTTARGSARNIWDGYSSVSTA